MEAIIVSILGMIPGLIKAISEFRNAAQQSGEWTVEMEAQYQAALKATNVDPAWQPDRE